jgi:hypothetical protein
MARRKEPKAAKAGIPMRMDSASIEEQTVQRVNRTMATMEGFLSRWDASAKKPEAILPQVAKIRRFHEALSGWRRMSLREKGSKDETGRIRRLRDFVMICRAFS